MARRKGDKDKKKRMRKAVIAGGLVAGGIGLAGLGTYIALKKKKPINPNINMDVGDPNDNLSFKFAKEVRKREEAANRRRGRSTAPFPLVPTLAVGGTAALASGLLSPYKPYKDRKPAKDRALSSLRSTAAGGIAGGLVGAYLSTGAIAPNKDRMVRWGATGAAIGLGGTGLMETGRFIKNSIINKRTGYNPKTESKKSKRIITAS